MTEILLQFSSLNFFWHFFQHPRSLTWLTPGLSLAEPERRWNWCVRQPGTTTSSKFRVTILESLGSQIEKVPNSGSDHPVLELNRQRPMFSNCGLLMNETLFIFEAPENVEAKFIFEADNRDNEPIRKKNCSAVFQPL